MSRRGSATRSRQNSSGSSSHAPAEPWRDTPNTEESGTHSATAPLFGWEAPVAAAVAPSAHAESPLFRCSDAEGESSGDEASDGEHSSASETEQPVDASTCHTTLLPPAALPPPARARPSALAVAAQASSSARRAAAAAAVTSSSDEEEEEEADEEEAQSDADSSDSSSHKPAPAKKRRKRNVRASARAAAASAATAASSGSAASRTRRLARASKDEQEAEERGSSEESEEADRARPVPPISLNAPTRRSGGGGGGATVLPSPSPSSSSPATPAVSAAGAPSLDAHAEGFSPMECGVIRRGVRVFEEFIPFFGKAVELYTASIDPRRRVLVRASTLADKFACATNKVGMYLSRRRHVSDGLYQAAYFKFKPPKRTGLKSGGYFLSEDVCLEFEKHYAKHSEKHAKTSSQGGADADVKSPQSRASRRAGVPSTPPTPSSNLLSPASSVGGLTPTESKRRLGASSAAVAAATAAGTPALSWPACGDDDPSVEPADVSPGSDPTPDETDARTPAMGRKRKTSGASSSSKKAESGVTQAASVAVTSPAVSVASRRASPFGGSTPMHAQMQSPSTPFSTGSAKRQVKPSAGTAPEDGVFEAPSQPGSRKKRAKVASQASSPPPPHPHHSQSVPLMQHPPQHPPQLQSRHALSLPLPVLQVGGPRAMIPALDSPGQLSVLTSSRPASSSSFHTDATLVMRSRSGSVSCPSSVSAGIGFGGGGGGALQQQHQQSPQQPLSMYSGHPSPPLSRAHSFLPHDFGSPHAHQAQQLAAVHLGSPPSSHPAPAAAAGGGSSGSHLDDFDSMFARIRNASRQPMTNLSQPQQATQQQKHSQLPPQHGRSSLPDAYFNPNEQFMFQERRDAYVHDAASRSGNQQQPQQQLPFSQHLHGLHGQQSSMHAQASSPIGLDGPHQRLMSSSPTGPTMTGGGSGGGGGGERNTPQLLGPDQPNPLSSLNLSREAIAALQAKVQRALDELQELQGQAAAAAVQAQSHSGLVHASLQSSPVGTVTSLSTSHSTTTMHSHSYPTSGMQMQMQMQSPPLSTINQDGFGSSMHAHNHAHAHAHAHALYPSVLHSSSAASGAEDVGGKMPSIMHEELTVSSGFQGAADRAAGNSHHHPMPLSAAMQLLQPPFMHAFDGGAVEGDPLAATTAAASGAAAMRFHHSSHSHGHSLSPIPGLDRAGTVSSTYSSSSLSFERDMSMR